VACRIAAAFGSPFDDLMSPLKKGYVTSFFIQ
jgi:hypothetical protein